MVVVQLCNRLVNNLQQNLNCQKKYEGKGGFTPFLTLESEKAEKTPRLISFFWLVRFSPVCNVIVVQLYNKLVNNFQQILNCQKKYEGRGGFTPFLTLESEKAEKTPRLITCFWLVRFTPICKVIVVHLYSNLVNNIQKILTSQNILFTSVFNEM